MHDSVTVRMAATPERVWDLISDIRNTGRWSPETIDAQWVDGATAPAVGVRFRGKVRRNGYWPVYWTTCEIIACEPGREFAFAVVIAGQKLNVWRYSFAPVDGGVEVTESFSLAHTPLLRLYWALLGWARGRTNVNGMRETLNRVKAVAEAEPAG